MKTVYLETVTSTNDYIKQNRALFTHGDSVYTFSQTAGRGRRGRSWTLNGKGIAFSVFISNCGEPLLLPIVASLAVYDTLLLEGLTEISVKWPNDILAGSKKLAGILCEAVDGGYIVGIGINNKETARDLEEAGLIYATSVSALTGKTLDPEKFVTSVAERTVALLEKRSEVIAEKYRPVCSTLGKEVLIERDGGTVTATAVGTDELGGLVIEHGGIRETVISGEVSVRGIYGR